ncbi:MAG: M20/M25/M40 family metallo-hydrolase [Clostridia bacterium]|nr:M20/M25/M40 family metallo-hydrolase [Clostridia bacterium]
MNSDVDAAPVTYSAHMDTVHPVGSFGTPAVRREGDKMYGPGVTDCKGGLVAALLAMDALERCGFRSRPIRFLLQSDEEGGSRVSNKATIGYMCQKSLDSIAFFNLEGGTEGTACVERKGILTYLIKVKGVEAHSSLCAVAGANAIAAAAHMILELEKYKDNEGITCNCGIISGGTAHNTVAGYCEFGVNIRFVNAEQRAQIAEVVHRLAASPYVPECQIEVEEYGSRPAMERVERNLALLETVNGIFAENGLSRLEPAKRTGGSDAAQITESGIPCLDSLGPIGGRIHSPDEYAVMETLKDSAKRLAAVAYCI